MEELTDFHHQLISEVQGDADALGLITVEAFFELVGELLTEAGEIDTANRAYFEGSYSRARVQVDGYGGDPRDSDGVLSLILCDFSLDKDIRSFNKEHIQKLFQRLFRFLTNSLDYKFKEQLEESSAGFGLADMIKSTWGKVDKVKLIIVTNAEYRARTDAVNFTEIDDKEITLSVWDLKRIKRFMEQGEARATTLIDFLQDFGGGIPLLPAFGNGEALESYLAVMPGAQLAAIYEKWGPRLLEANVRSFLQARGKVNKGIRNTIRDEPHMFFSYNNGLSVTADRIETKETESGLIMTSADNFQIVNGGQTTASLHAARKAYEEQLEQVFVQLKLTITPKTESEEIVPRISEFANSQNKVNAADFFSNHPFHIRTEELSRRILAPAGINNYRETKWFYERARGQYADARSRRGLADRKKFDAEYPRSQFFTKTDLAKYENTWACLPHVVSLGAQKNFAEFAKNIGKRWGTDGLVFDELWFKRMIAKAIIFKATEKLVSNAQWYEGGYRANIVTYSIAKLVHDAQSKEMLIDLDAIWRSQSISEGLKSSLLVVGSLAQRVITNPPDGIRNYSEWAKKQICWQWLSESKLDYPISFSKALTTAAMAEENTREARAENRLANSINNEVEVVNLGSEFWADARDWARQRTILSPRELSILEVCAAIPRKIPTEKQSLVALQVLEKLREHGFMEKSKG